METKSVLFDGQAFEYEKDEQKWQLRLRRSDILTEDMRVLRLLDWKHPMLLEEEVSYDDESVTFSYKVETDQLEQEAIQALPTSEKLRIAINSLDLADCLHLPITFFLHPDNLFVTKNGRLKIAYRGLPDLMIPRKIDEADFLRQVKCLIITFFTKQTFTELYDGGLDIVDLPDFLKEVRQTETLSETRELLENFYRERKEKEEKSFISVRKNRYQLYKYLTIWFSALTAILLIPLIYLVFIRQPFQEKLLSADTAFVKVDYSGVISKLENVKLAKIPYSQKYELAYSYIQGLDLKDDQKNVVLNNVTLKSDELYFDYWIEIGRGENSKAVDLAKRLDDTDLILYALAQEIDQVRNNSNLSGSKRDEKLDSLQSDYDKYWKDRTNDLNGDSNSTDSSSSTKTSSSDK